MMRGADGSTTFPALQDEEREHSARLLEAVRAELAARGGWMPFSEYQQWVLYAPGLGYYSGGAAKFGAAGDFITAPEISPLFGRAAAAWIAPLLAACGPGAELLELGAGSGALAREILAALQAAGQAPAAYNILEVSGDLRERQRGTLEHYTVSRTTTVRWLDRLPAQFHGVILANEMLDALACERFTGAEDGLLARGVSLRGGRLVDELRAPGSVANAPLHAAGLLGECYRRFERELALSGCTIPAGYCGEFIPALRPFVAALAGSLSQGAIVLVDYGLPRRQLYLPERSDGTLRCVRRHHAHDDPFRDPGLTDITCWVDFTTVAEAGTDSGLELRAFATQMAWLLDAGIERTLSAAMQAAGTDGERMRLAQGVKTLLLPGEMGEAVKMMCLTRNLPAHLGTVGTRDLREGL